MQGKHAQSLPSRVEIGEQLDLQGAPERRRVNFREPPHRGPARKTHHDMVGRRRSGEQGCEPGVVRRIGRHGRRPVADLIRHASGARRIPPDYGHGKAARRQALRAGAADPARSSKDHG
ncbi:MAG: hypothetical protein QM690_10155 [Sphingobium sp.]